MCSQWLWGHSTCCPVWNGICEVKAAALSKVVVGDVSRCVRLAELGRREDHVRHTQARGGGQGDSQGAVGLRWRGRAEKNCSHVSYPWERVEVSMRRGVGLL